MSAIESVWVSVHCSDTHISTSYFWLDTIRMPCRHIRSHNSRSYYKSLYMQIAQQQHQPAKFLDASRLSRGTIFIMTLLREINDGYCCIWKPQPRTACTYMSISIFVHSLPCNFMIVFCPSVWLNFLVYLRFVKVKCKDEKKFSKFTAMQAEQRKKTIILIWVFFFIRSAFAMKQSTRKTSTKNT